MELLQIITLAIIQGLTEFLPISSSGHLVLAPIVTGWPDQGLALDVATHVGTLVAVIAYFYQDIVKITKAGLTGPFAGRCNKDCKKFYLLILAAVPVALAGLIFADFIEQNLRSALVIALASIGFGLLLQLADVKGPKLRDDTSIGFKDALIIGLMQILALIPGTSRSGITMTAGLMLGLSRKASARFSFLLAIPVIFLAGSYETYKLITEPAKDNWSFIIIAATVAAIVAFLCIHFFLQLINKIGMLPFVIYRVLLGLILLLVFYT